MFKEPNRMFTFDTAQITWLVRMAIWHAASLI
jgi:hypothetical protein